MLGADLVTDWTALTARAALASHRLIGWIYWDPVAIEHYAALGVPDNGFGYYIATRGATLGDAGNQVVTAAFYSINADGTNKVLRFTQSSLSNTTTDTS
jgi:hypothetical protein